MMNTIQIGETRDQGMLRIHRFRSCLKLTDLTNAGKRGKKVRAVWVISNRPMRSDDEEQYMGRLCMAVELAQSLNAALATLRDVFSDYPGDTDLDEREERGVDVAPAGFQSTTVEGKRVRVTLEFTTFMVACTQDKANEPRIMNNGPKRANMAKFKAWFQANRKSLATMSLSDVQHALSANGIDYHYWCAVD